LTFNGNKNRHHIPSQVAVHVVAKRRSSKRRDCVTFVKESSKIAQVLGGFNPFEKYASQNGSFCLRAVRIKNI